MTSMFKHKSVLQCWQCDQPIRGEERRWVRHNDGLAYAYCQKCVDKLKEEPK